MGSFNRSHSNFERDLGEGDMGVEVNHSGLVSRSSGEVGNGSMGEAKLDLEPVLLGVELEILKVMTKGVEDVVKERIGSLESHQPVFNFVHSKRKGVVGEVRGLVVA